MLLNHKIFKNEQAYLNNLFPAQPQQEGLSKWLYHILQRCLAQDPTNLPTLETVLNEIDHYLLVCYHNKANSEHKAKSVIDSPTFQVDY